MPRKIEYKRVRKGLVFADVGEVHREILDRMVAEDHSDATKFLRWLLAKEWKLRTGLDLVEVIGEEVDGDKPVPVYGVR